MAAVRAACLDGDGADPLDEAAQLRLKHHGLDATHRLWIVDEHGFALVREATLDLVVAPGARGRGLGGRLAAAVLTGAPVATAWSHGDHPAAAALAERHGFARVRELWVMRRPATTPLPTLEIPADLTIRGYRPDDAAAVLAVNAAAFAHHPEQGGMDDADLAARMAEPWFDPAGLLLAVDGDGALLGFHWTKRHSPDLGEVYVVAISPSAQGRGLGRLLTLAGLHHLAEAGVREILLYVESDNLPARAVYERLGFTHAPADTHVMYARAT
ncbi:mycothiol synthase [Nocardioides sp.]|uniref:mycothiol synthase n=1 Tax=Nocardioides sp. TaxID=35761 RepID=UPI003528F65C